jgi:hypothetical protein
MGRLEIILTETVKSKFKYAPKKQTGEIGRDFMAKVVADYLNGSARKVETFLGWNP